MGIGFIGHPYPEEFPDNFKFIRGNHDRPDLCRKHHNYLGDYGYLEDLNLFYVSGGFSIDQWARTVGIDWWEDEELSITELQEMTDLFVEKKPKIVMSHVLPIKIAASTLNLSEKINSRTEDALQEAFDRHKPERWYCSHYHQSKTIKGETLFKVVNTNCFAEWYS